MGGGKGGKCRMTTVDGETPVLKTGCGLQRVVIARRGGASGWDP